MRANITHQMHKALKSTGHFFVMSINSLKNRIDESQTKRSRGPENHDETRTKPEPPQTASSSNSITQPESDSAAKAKPSTSNKKETSTSPSSQEDLPIKNYQKLTVKEITHRLNRLDQEEIKQLKTFENRHKKRKTLLDAFNRQLH